MIEHRIARRTEVRLDVVVATVVNSGPATVTDISETGAKIMYPDARPGERVSLVALGQDVCGTVAWADPDRFGMKFDQCLTEGPLHGYLRQISAPRPRAIAPRTFGRRAA
jgi:hypothetical protein